MTYNAVSPIVADAFVDSFLDGEPIDLEHFEVDDQQSDIEAQLDFVAAVKDLHRKESKKLLKRTSRFDEFEIGVTEQLDKLRSRSSDDAIFDHGFWIYLGCATIDAHSWRYSDSTGLNFKANLGLRQGQFTESLFGRLLVRMEIVKSHPELSTFVGQDFWRSHIMRTNWGRNSDLARAFTQVVVEEGLKTDDHRKMAKLIKSRNSNLLLETFDFEDSMEIVKQSLDEIRG